MAMESWPIEAMLILSGISVAVPPGGSIYYEARRHYWDYGRIGAHAHD